MRTIEVYSFLDSLNQIGKITCIDLFPVLQREPKASVNANSVLTQIIVWIFRAGA